MENSKIVIRPIALLVALAFAGSAGAVGHGTVVSGKGNIVKQGNVVSVNQSTDKMIVNWDNMNVGQAERLNFKQPGQRSAVLNKINSIDPTVIAGMLTATGNVFVVNPNGVLISNGATVSVGSLIASSLDISNNDFNRGNYNFTGNGKGKVVNEGNIIARNSVAMIGAGEVSNNGRVISGSGNVNLAAGSDITLNFPAMGKISIKVNKGSLEALINNGGLIVSQQGSVMLTAWATDTLTRGVINNSGTLEAGGFSLDINGGVYLTSKGNGEVNLGGTLDSYAGGNIVAAGKNITVADATALSARSTQLTSTAKDGYVKFGQASRVHGDAAITADNVLTAAGGRAVAFDGDVSVAALTANNLDVATAAAVDENKITAGKGMVSSGFVDAVNQSGKKLSVSNIGGDITLNNAQQNYGRLALDSGHSVNINSRVNGDSLSIAAQNVNQASGSKIAMRDSASLQVNGGFTQNDDISAGKSLALASGTALTQKAGINNTADSVSYNANRIALDGDTDAGSLSLTANDSLTQGATSHVTARNGWLSGGDFDLSAGQNSLERIDVSANSLDLVSASDISIGDNSTLSDLTISSDRGLSTGKLNVWGNADIRAQEDVTLTGDMQVGNSLAVDADNIIAKQAGTSGWWRPQQASITAQKMSLKAKGAIDLGNTSAGEYQGGNADIEATDINIANLSVGNNANVRASKGVSINDLNGSSATVSGDGGVTIDTANIFGDLAIKSNGDLGFQSLSGTGNVDLSALNIRRKDAYGYGYISAGSKLTLNAKNTVDVNELRSGNDNCSWSSNNPLNKDLLVNAGDIFVSQINANGSVKLNAVKNSSASEGDIKISQINAYLGATDLNAQHDIVLGNHGGSDINVQAGNDISISSLSSKNATITGHGAVELNSTDLAGDLAVTTTGDLGFSRLESEGAVKLSAADIHDVKNHYGNNTLFARKTVELNADKSLDIDSITTSDHYYWGTISDSQNRSLSINAGDIAVNSINSAGDISLNAVKQSADAKGDIRVTSLSAKGKGTLVAGHDITLGNSVVNDNLSVNVVGDLSIAGNISSDKNVSMKAGNIKAERVYSSWGWWSEPSYASISAANVDLQADNGLNLGEVSAYARNLASGNVQMKAKDIAVKGTISGYNVSATAENDVSIQSINACNACASPAVATGSAKVNISGNDVRVDGGNIGGDVEINARKDINFIAETQPISDVSLVTTGGDIYFGDYDNTRWNNYHNLTLDASGLVRTYNNMSVSNDLSIKAGEPGIYLPSKVVVSGNANLSTPGNVIQQADYSYYGYQQFSVGKDLTYTLSANSKLINESRGDFTTNVDGKTTTIIK